MSVTKNQPTNYSASDTDVIHKMAYVRIDGLDQAGLPNLRINAGFAGRIADTEGIVESNDVTATRQMIVDNLSAEERQAGKAFIAAIEREAAKLITSLKDEIHDASDVMD
jgi:hypothetical protein